MPARAWGVNPPAAAGYPIVVTSTAPMTIRKAPPTMNAVSRSRPPRKKYVRTRPNRGVVATSGATWETVPMLIAVRMQYCAPASEAPAKAKYFTGRGEKR